MPVSATSMCTRERSGAHVACTSTRPPAGVNLTALLTRFTRMRRTFSQSLMMSGTSASTAVDMATPFLSATGWLEASTMPTMSLRSTSSRLSRSDPAWMRAVSSTLSTISSNMAPFFSISSSCRREAASAGSTVSAMRSANARMEVSGVRSSWLTMARKSDL